MAVEHSGSRDALIDVSALSHPSGRPLVSVPPVSRRRILGVGGAGVAALLLGGRAQAYQTPEATPGAGGMAGMATPQTGQAAAKLLPLRFFNDAEARVVTAMAERIFPGDANGPGATDAHVMSYIDGQMAGGWGQGQRFYRQGPFEQPTDSGHGWQLALQPAQAYKFSLAALDAHCRRQFNNSFDRLSTDQQDAVLTDMAAGKIDTFDVLPSDQFFALFRGSVVEGLFSDPLHDGNFDMVGWKWIGFPGDPMAYGDPYGKYIEQYNQPYNVAPQPLQ